MYLILPNEPCLMPRKSETIQSTAENQQQNVFSIRYIDADIQLTDQWMYLHAFSAGVG